jgi:5-methylcytosine-specific restriction endonuclease McrA
MGKGILNDSVLVTNKHYVAVNVAAARDIFGRLFNNDCTVVYGEFENADFNQWKAMSADYTGSDVVHTVRYKLRVPSVIRLLRFERLPHREVRFTRDSLFDRDKNCCQYCGKRFRTRDLNIDHVQPKSRGGKTEWENLVCSCEPCNTKKADRTPAEAGMHLIRQPKKPMWRPFISANFDDVAKDDWKRYLELAGWELTTPGA